MTHMISNVFEAIALDTLPDATGQVCGQTAEAFGFVVDGERRTKLSFWPLAPLREGSRNTLRNVILSPRCTPALRLRCATSRHCFPYVAPTTALVVPKAARLRALRFLPP